ncbi:glycosyltransferase [Aestuariivivens sediminicola]|uniref:glycosyltransferase n=1 Tax=Aestuariivivens sediminicola TaxID=2913560 RepID=UPI001F5764B7|nr:glycosyltransferase [Aestuariivivens sediminicola]
MFKHFLITRFNLRNPDWTTSKKNKSVLTKEWHDNRFELFTNFCFESVKGQTNTNFEWLVYFDTTTPEKFKTIIRDLEKKMPNFIPIFIDGMSLFLPSITSYIAKCSEPYIITSRIDNDDCLGKQYIATVQKQFNRQDFMAVDFIDGYTIQTHPQIKIGKRLDQYNPFISLIEKNNNPKTVWSIRHSHWKREKHVLQLKGERHWASIIHEENKVNEFEGYGNVDVDIMFQNFAISKIWEQRIKAEAIPYSKWKFQSFLNRLESYWDYAFRNMKKALGVYKFK